MRIDIKKDRRNYIRLGDASRLFGGFERGERERNKLILA